VGASARTSLPDCALVVFARAPVAGQVKTRLFRADPAVAQAALGRVLSAEDAAHLHAAFVEDVLRKGEQSGLAPRWLYAADAGENETLSRLATAHGYATRIQRGRDLGARMASAFEEVLAADAGGLALGPASPRVPAAILVGTDSPSLPIAYLREAAAALAAGCDVVLGPACDGGYYLIGLRQPLPALFPADLPWGTAEVLPRTLDLLRRQAREGRQSHLLPFFYDCDTPGDLRLLRDHLALSQRPLATPRVGEPAETEAPATRRRLQELGLWGMEEETRSS
jgi:hypothetical protein